MLTSTLAITLVTQLPGADVINIPVTRRTPLRTLHSVSLIGRNIVVLIKAPLCSPSDTLIRLNIYLRQQHVIC